MEVSWLPDSLQERGKWFGSRRKGTHRLGALRRYGIVGLAASLMVATGVWFASNSLYPARAEAYAFVSVDINPSLLFQVDKNLKVVSFEGENPDGTKLLSSLHLKGMNLSNAMEQVIQEAAAMNMLPTADSILVASAPVSSTANVARIRNEVNQDVNNAIQANPTAQSLRPQVFSLGLSETVWHAATSAKISPAKLAAYLIARDEGMNLTLAQLTGPTLQEVLSHPSPTALDALSSSNLSVIEQFISQLQQSGMLTGLISPKNVAQEFPANQTTKPAANRTNPPPVSKGQNQTPAHNQTQIHTHRSSHGQDGTVSIPTITIRFGTASFSIQVGNPASDRSKKKNSTPPGPDKGHSSHADKMTIGKSQDTTNSGTSGSNRNNGIAGIYGNSENGAKNANNASNRSGNRGDRSNSGGSNNDGSNSDGSNSESKKKGQQATNEFGSTFNYGVGSSSNTSGSWNSSQYLQNTENTLTTTVNRLTHRLLRSLDGGH